MSEPRKLEALRAIVEDYVHSRCPSGPRPLSIWAFRVPPSATTWRRWRTKARPPLRTRVRAGSRPTRTNGCSLTRFPPSNRCPWPRRAIQALLEGSEDLDDVLERTVRTVPADEPGRGGARPAAEPGQGPPCRIRAAELRVVHRQVPGGGTAGHRRAEDLPDDALSEEQVPGQPGRDAAEPAGAKHAGRRRQRPAGPGAGLRRPWPAAWRGTGAERARRAHGHGRHDLARSNAWASVSIVLEALEDRWRRRACSRHGGGPPRRDREYRPRKPTMVSREASVVATGYATPKVVRWAPPGWTTPPPWPRSVQWPGTCS